MSEQGLCGEEEYIRRRYNDHQGIIKNKIESENYKKERQSILDETEKRKIEMQKVEKSSKFLYAKIAIESNGDVENVSFSEYKDLLVAVVRIGINQGLPPEHIVANAFDF